MLVIRWKVKKNNGKISNINKGSKITLQVPPPLQVDTYFLKHLNLSDLFHHFPHILAYLRMSFYYKKHVQLRFKELLACVEVMRESGIWQRSGMLILEHLSIVRFLTDFKNVVKLLSRTLNYKVFSFEKALMGGINHHSLK